MAELWQKMQGENLADRGSTDAFVENDPRVSNYNWAIDGWYDEVNKYDFRKSFEHLNELQWEL